MHDLVRLQGGRCEVASTPGVGTNVTVRLPTGQAHLDPQRMRVAGGRHADASAPAPLAAAESFLPQVALLDIGLPVMDGYEVARRLQHLPALPPPGLVAITGYGQEQDLARSTAAGFDAHLVKPVDLGALRQVLARLVEMPPGDDAGPGGGRPAER